VHFRDDPDVSTAMFKLLVLTVFALEAINAQRLTVSTQWNCMGSKTEDWAAGADSTYYTFGLFYLKATCSGYNTVTFKKWDHDNGFGQSSTTCTVGQCCYIGRSSTINSGFYAKASGLCTSGGGSSSDYTWWNGVFSLQSLTGDSACMNDPNPCDRQCAQSYASSISGNTLTLQPRSAPPNCQCVTLQATFSDANSAAASGSGYSATATRNTGNGATVVMSANGAQCTGVYAKSDAIDSKHISFVITIAMIVTTIVLV